MATTACADSSFGLSGQSIAIMALLAATPPDFAAYDPRKGYDVKIGTFPWYNGHEKGVAVTVGLEDGQFCRIFAFGESMVSGDVFVEHWDQTVPYNAPTFEERLDQVGPDFERRSFDPGRVDLVVKHIIDLMTDFYEEQRRFSPRTNERVTLTLVQR